MPNIKALAVVVSLKNIFRESILDNLTLLKENHKRIISTNFCQNPRALNYTVLVS